MEIRFYTKHILTKWGFISLLKHTILSVIILIISSCNTSTQQQRDKEGNTKEGRVSNEMQGEANTFKFHLNPTPGSQYYYTISNESNLELEVNGKKMYNQSKSNCNKNWRCVENAFTGKRANCP